MFSKQVQVGKFHPQGWKYRSVIYNHSDAKT